MPGRHFWDSNLWIYLNTTSEDSFDVEKKNKLEALLLEASDIVVSVQVLNEVANVLLKKFQQTEAEVKSRLEQIIFQSEVVPLQELITFQALDLKSHYKLSWFDSLIAAAALNSGCDFLYSEDLQDGLLIAERLRVVNPFN